MPVPLTWVLARQTWVSALSLARGSMCRSSGPTPSSSRTRARGCRGVSSCSPRASGSRGPSASRRHTSTAWRRWASRRWPSASASGSPRSRVASWPGAPRLGFPWSKCRCPLRSSLSRSASRTSLRTTAESLQRVVAFQQSLTRRTLREGPAGLVAGLAAELRAPVALLDEHGRRVAASARAQALSRRVSAELQEHRLPRSHGATHRFRTETGEVEMHAVTGRSAHRGGSLSL